MNITRDNYEQYFLDYYEGSLDQVGVLLLMSFLDQHSDLKEEFESFRMITLEEDSSFSLGSKEFLKKEVIGPDNADTFFAAYVEDDLTPAQRTETEFFIAEHPSKQHDLELMKQTILFPDMSVRYANKASLKKHKIVPLYRRLWYSVSVAAVVLILAGLFFNLEKTTPELAITIPEPLVNIEAVPLVIKTPSEVVLAEKQVVVSPAPKPVREVEVREMPQPLLASRIKGKTTPALPTTRVSASASDMEPRTEFAYWSHTLLQEDNDEELTGKKAAGSTTLAKLAINRIQDKLPQEVKEAEERLSGGRLSLRHVASEGLAGIASLLNVKQERDENGKVIQVAVGDAFEYKRK